MLIFVSPAMLPGVLKGCDRASAKDFHEIRAVFTRGVARVPPWISSGLLKERRLSCEVTEGTEPVTLPERALDGSCYLLPTPLGNAFCDLLAAIDRSA